MWSMPGSSPASLTIGIPARFAGSSSSRIAGLTYEVVTIGLRCSTARRATATW
jgi:hypothetical protein